MPTPTDTTAMETTGLSTEGAQDRDVEALNQLIADATVLYQKVRHYHWNVEGRHFFELHAKFEALYTDWAGSIDELAERVRALGGRPIHTLANVLENATLEEDPTTPNGVEMMRRLAADLEQIHAAIDGERDQAAAQYDQGTADLMTDLQVRIEKDLWMMKAWLKEACGQTFGGELCVLSPFLPVVTIPPLRPRS